MKHVLLLLLPFLAAYCAQAQNKDVSAAIDYTDRQLAEQVASQLAKIDWSSAAHRTTSAGVLYTIPVVVHVVHDYGAELVPDNAVYQLIDHVSTYFLKHNADTVNIIDKFKPVAASTQIDFRLAGKDPVGHPTKGIDHIFSYLTYVANNQVKMNQWPQDHYLNIWLVNGGGASVYSYANGSAYAAYYPYYDGIVLNYSYLTAPLVGGSVGSLFAKYLNLHHPCADFCYDADMIPDTPPCGQAAVYTCANVADTTCDTANVQNIMTNNDVCAIMFTYGQGQYMQYILQIDIGNRDSLSTPYNNIAAGVAVPKQDLPMVPDYCVRNGAGQLNRFFCQNQQVRFDNKSWNDTLVASAWTFSNSAEVSASSSLYSINNRFHQPGWVTTTLSATGNNTAAATLTDDHSLFIADSVAVDATGYLQTFDPGVGMAQWPMFNYYKNNFKWQLADLSFSGNSYLFYSGYDSRPFPENKAGSPKGDYDDVFTPAFDLTSLGNPCYLNFISSGACLTADNRYIMDTLEIDYSTDHAATWRVLNKLTKGQLVNKGTITTPYIPLVAGDWKTQSIFLPPAARTAYTIFRLRYHPGADSAGSSTGNNFFLDNFHFSKISETLAVENAVVASGDVLLAPNPTGGGTSVVINLADPVGAFTITVTDITGKLVFTTTGNINERSCRIEVPADKVGARGIYLVHIITNTINRTEKLIVE